MISIGRRPTESDIAPEQVVTKVAPISDIATIRPSIVGSFCKLNSFFMYKTAPKSHYNNNKQLSSRKINLDFNF